MKVFDSNLIVSELPDTIIIQKVNGYGTTYSAGGGIINLSGARTIVIAHRVDSSNYAVSLFPNPSNQSGQVVEVYPDSNGSVTVFLGSDTFVDDGTSSMVVTRGARFTFTGFGWCRIGS